MSCVETHLPLEGVLVVDLSRMLPGAVVVRQLVDLGARVVKVEGPEGDPMRLVPPMAGEHGAGFEAFFRGVESVVLDLDDEAQRHDLEALLQRADICLLSSRPKSLRRRGLHPDSLVSRHPRLVALTLWSWPGEAADVPAHDLNLAAETGVLDALGGRIPRVQVVDVLAGMAATSALLAALLERERTGRGRVIHQPLASGSLPLLTWIWANVGVSGTEGAVSELLGGGSPCYRLYRTSDEAVVAVACVEEKFWNRLVERLGVPELRGQGWSFGEAGRQVADRLAERLCRLTLAEVRELASREELPISQVRSPAEAFREPLVAPLLGEARSDGSRSVGSFLGVGSPPGRRAPRLGEHTEAVLAEFGAADVDRSRGGTR